MGVRPGELVGQEPHSITLWLVVRVRPAPPRIRAQLENLAYRLTPRSKMSWYVFGAHRSAVAGAMRSHKLWLGLSPPAAPNSGTGERRQMDRHDVRRGSGPPLDMRRSRRRARARRRRSSRVCNGQARVCHISADTAAAQSAARGEFVSDIGVECNVVLLWLAKSARYRTPRFVTAAFV
jgi:hypothetical protein